MKKFMLLINVAFTISLINAGVSINTIIETPEGSKNINDLKVGDQVICIDEALVPKIKPIISIEEVEVKSAIEITTEDDAIILVSTDQRVFASYKWIPVDQLCLGDSLLKQNQTPIKIKGICYRQEPILLRFITVEEHHNFLVSKNGILIHNGYWGANFGCFLGKFLVHAVGHGAMFAIACCTGGGFYVTYTALAATFAAPLEAASNVGALAGGIIGGTATGLI